jgi:hypothetical protein
VTVTGNDPGLWDPPDGLCQHCGGAIGWRSSDRLAFSDDDQLVQYKAVCEAECAGFRGTGEALSAQSGRYARWESRY